MTPERWARLKEVFGGAFERPEVERSAYLDSACSGDSELRVEVERLLADGDDSLHSPAGGILNAASELAPGDTVAHYRIEARLGAGGMGVVYRARDSRLGRSVALKFVKADFGSRSQREARAVAALNHPNICTLHDVGPNYLVMELIEGPTLAERIAKGPVPLQEALEMARQIAEAMEAAHEKGIIHRDLKPANIKLTADGTVKVLDFGLAKTREPASGSQEDSPTLTATQAGMILGTAAYMSPEQAIGKPVDKRADIWAFGVVFYELLTGHRLFDGETVTQTLANVLNGPIDPDMLPPAIPAAIKRLLARCLDRNVRNRLRDIGEARVALEHVEADTPAALLSTATRPSPLPWIVAGVALAAGLGGVGARWLRPNPAAPSKVAFPLSMPAGVVEVRQGALAQTSASPDGQYVAFIARTDDGNDGIWVRPMSSPGARLLEKTRGASVPFWSPDSQFIGFFAEGKLKRVPLAGGSMQTLCEAISEGSVYSGNGGTWSTDGVIVFAPFREAPLMRVSASGGQSRPATTLDVSAGEIEHTWPQFLPDGRHVLYFARNRDPEKSGIYVQDLGSSQRVLVMRNRYRAAWSPPGYLLFLHTDGTLFAQRMDPKTFRPVGEPAAVAADVTANGALGRAAFAVSESGVLTYRQGSTFAGSRISWYNRVGKTLGSVGKPGDYLSIRLSPDKKQASIVLSQLLPDLWVMDLSSGVLTRATSLGNGLVQPGPWSPDSERVMMNTDAEGIEVTLASGKTRTAVQGWLAEDWSPDNRELLCSAHNGRLLAALRLEDGARPQVLSETRRPRYSFRFSSDGHYVAYASEEPGQREIFVASFPSFAEKRQVSVDGGAWPSWRKDGKELFFVAPGGMLMAAGIRSGAKLESTLPVVLFHINVNPNIQAYDPSGDGQHFLVLDVPAQNGQTMIMVNWKEGLKLP